MEDEWLSTLKRACKHCNRPLVEHRGNTLNCPVLQYEAPLFGDAPIVMYEANQTFEFKEN